MAEHKYPTRMYVEVEYDSIKFNTGRTAIVGCSIEEVNDILDILCEARQYDKSDVVIHRVCILGTHVDFVNI